MEILALIAVVGRVHGAPEAVIYTKLMAIKMELQYLIDIDVIHVMEQENVLSVTVAPLAMRVEVLDMN